MPEAPHLEFAVSHWDDVTDHRPDHKVAKSRGLWLGPRTGKQHKSDGVKEDIDTDDRAERDVQAGSP